MKESLDIATPAQALHRLNAAISRRTTGAIGPVQRDGSFAVDALCCLLAVAIGAAYIGHFAWRQWLPWDDGTMAQAAERVLNGQLPHRDFNEPYTGGLTWLHAAAFH